MSNGAGKPKPAFYAAIAVIVLGLVGFAVYRFTAKKKDDKAPEIDPAILKNGSGSAAAKQITPESPDGKTVATTEKTYEWEPASRLPEVKGTGNYTALGTPATVRFAVNIWAGWAPIIWANQGNKAKKVWKTAKGKEFQVELKLIDDPIAMGDSVAAGTAHIGWATVDMLPLIVERLKRDPRTMPRVYQQIDWSNGGDGIVVREGIKDVGMLKGKTVVLAQNSPSHFFLLNALLSAGVQPRDVTLKYNKTAFQAAAAFAQNKNIDGVVTWAPDIYTLTEGKTGNKLLISTATANKLIADVWFARADFGRDNPDIIEALVRGIFDATEELKTDQNKDTVSSMMDTFYSLDPGTGKKMLGDAHWTNFAENRDFFLVETNPTNFERTYDTAFRLYKAIKVVEDKTDFDKIADFTYIKKLAGEEKYASQKNTYEFVFTPKGEAPDLEKKVLTKTVTINFFPNSHDVFKKVTTGNKEVYYDGNVEYTIEEIAKLAGQFGAAQIVIEGHTDASMKGVADEGLVKDLSKRRADAVKAALVNKYKMNPAQFTSIGAGWSKPLDPADNAKNRRVEVQVVPAEAQ